MPFFNQLVSRYSYVFMLKKSSRYQTESESDEKPYIWFSMGIDHSNPYIHSTTLLCDIKTSFCITSHFPKEGHQSLGKY